MLGSQPQRPCQSGIKMQSDRSFFGERSAAMAAWPSQYSSERPNPRSVALAPLAPCGVHLPPPADVVFITAASGLGIHAMGCLIRPGLTGPHPFGAGVFAPVQTGYKR